MPVSGEEHSNQRSPKAEALGKHLPSSQGTSRKPKWLGQCERTAELQETASEV